MCNFISGLMATLFNPQNWSVDNILSMISIILAIIGGLFAYKKWSSATKTKRSEFTIQILEKLRFDKEMALTMNSIDYDMFSYDNFFHNSDKKLEYNIDKLLSYLSYVCYLYEEDNISKKEFAILKYEVTRVCISEPVQSYLWNLYHFSKQQGTTCSFQYLIDYGIKYGLIDPNSFYDPTSESYIKQLDFQSL